MYKLVLTNVAAQLVVTRKLRIPVVLSKDITLKNQMFWNKSMRDINTINTYKRHN